MREGWEENSFDEIISFSQIGIVRNNKEQSPNFPYRYFKMNNIRNNNGIDETSYSFVDGTEEEVKKYSLKNGDFLFNTRNSYELVGKTCMYVSDYADPTLFNNNILRVNFKDYVDPKFISYAFSSIAVNQQLEKMKSGTTNVVGIYCKNLKTLLIPIPPLSEQQQIVSILDQAFATIDQAKANVQRNIENTKELFQSKLNEIFSEKGDCWEEVALSQMTTSITDGDHMAPPKSEEGIPFITISNINKQSHQIDFSNTFFVPRDYYNNLKDNRKPKEGDLLYTVTGSFGIPVVVDFSKEFCFQRHIGLIRPNESTDTRWLYYWVLSPKAVNQSNEKATGTAQRTVSLKTLRNLKIPRVPYNIQLEMVETLNSISNGVSELLVSYQQKARDLDELKKSILQKAFNGELTAKPVPA